MSTKASNGDSPTSFSVPGYEDEVHFHGASSEEVAKIFEAAKPKLSKRSSRGLLITGTRGQTDTESEKLFKNV